VGGAILSRYGKSAAVEGRKEKAARAKPPIRGRVNTDSIADKRGAAKESFGMSSQEKRKGQKSAPVRAVLRKKERAKIGGSGGGSRDYFAAMGRKKGNAYALLVGGVKRPGT